MVTNEILRIDGKRRHEDGNKINYLYGDVKYFGGPNHLVIGTSHLHRLPQSEVPSFIATLNDLKGMKSESKDLPVNANIPFDIPEVLAKAAMIGKPFEYIADRRKNGDLLGKVLDEYLVPSELTEIFYGLAPLLTTAMRPIESAEDMASGFTSAINAAKKRCPDLNIERAVANHQRVVAALSDRKLSPQDFFNFCNAYYPYHGLLIEYEFMQPDILDFRKKIDGKLGVLVGCFHAEKLSGALDGHLIIKPPLWNTYETNLPLNLFDSVQLFKRLL